jgi:hypothetical protein
MKYDEYNNEIYKNLHIAREISINNIGSLKKLSQLMDDHFQDNERNFKVRQEILNNVKKKFWTSLKKVYIPYCQKGEIIIDIIDRFMIGLKSMIPCENERYGTIIQKCIYFHDPCTINLLISKTIIDPFNKYILNMKDGDTVLNKWKDIEFHGIFQNTLRTFAIWNQHEFQQKTAVRLVKRFGYGETCIGQKTLRTSKSDIF